MMGASRTVRISRGTPVTGGVAGNYRVAATAPGLIVAPAQNFVGAYQTQMRETTLTALNY
jgi:hypothetical protein